jgi:hypothetical protein
METEKIENVENEETIEDAIKITITKEANRSLGNAVNKINEGFEGGKVSRQTAASWMLEKICKELTEVDIKDIRSENFNPLNALSALMRRVQETGEVPLEIRQILFAQSGLESGTKKSSKTKLTKNAINDGLSESEV